MFWIIYQAYILGQALTSHQSKANQRGSLLSLQGNCAEFYNFSKEFLCPLFNVKYKLKLSSQTTGEFPLLRYFLSSNGTFSVFLLPSNQTIKILMLDLRLIEIFGSCGIKYIFMMKTIEISCTTTKDLKIIVPACSFQENTFLLSGTPDWYCLKCWTYHASKFCPGDSNHFFFI